MISLKNIYLLLNKPEVLTYLSLFESIQYKSRNEIEEYQLQKLKIIINDAYKIPFYKNLWDYHKIKPVINTIKDLENFPIITKDKLKDGIFKNEFDFKVKNLIWLKTTGSSGSPFTFPTDHKSEVIKYASKLRLQKWYSKDFSTTQVKFWRGNYHKNILTRIVEFIKRDYTLCIYDPKFPFESELSDKRIEYFIFKLNKIKPKIIDGFVSALVKISEYIIENDLALNFKPQSIVTGAEKLTESDRSKIKEAFRANVYNRYGGTETSVLAHECSSQSIDNHHLHILEDRMIVENNFNNELIYTDLSASVFPLIRYNTEDIGKILHSKECSCKINFKLIDKIEGRINEWFYLEDGRKLSSHIWQNYFKQTMGVKNYQIIQVSYTKYIVNWVKDDRFFNSTDHENLKRSVANALNNSSIEWNQLSKIPLGVGGKFVQHISHLK